MLLILPLLRSPGSGALPVFFQGEDALPLVSLSYEPVMDVVGVRALRRHSEAVAKRPAVCVGGDTGADRVAGVQA